MWPVVKNQISSVFLFGIMFFLPHFAFADVSQIQSTSTRAIGIVYQNLTGYPKYISVLGNNPSGNGSMDCYSAPISAPTSSTAYKVASQNWNNTSTMNTWCIVPNNYYFAFVSNAVGSPTISNWTEWDMALPTFVLTSTSTQPLYISDTTSSMFEGMTLLIAGFLTTIWFFRKPR